MERLEVEPSIRNMSAEIGIDADHSCRGLRNTEASDITMKFLRGVGIKNKVDPDTGKASALRDTYSWLTIGSRRSLRICRG